MLGVGYDDERDSADVPLPPLDALFWSNLVEVKLELSL